MESNLLQFSTLLFSNLEELKHFAVLKKRQIKGGFATFTSQDKMDLFSEVNTRQGVLDMRRGETKRLRPCVQLPLIGEIHIPAFFCFTFCSCSPCLIVGGLLWGAVNAIDLPTSLQPLTLFILLVIIDASSLVHQEMFSVLVLNEQLFFFLHARNRLLCWKGFLDYHLTLP